MFIRKPTFNHIRNDWIRNLTEKLAIATSRDVFSGKGWGKRIDEYYTPEVISNIIKDCESVGETCFPNNRKLCELIQKQCFDESYQCVHRIINNNKDLRVMMLNKSLLDAEFASRRIHHSLMLLEQPVSSFDITYAIRYGAQNGLLFTLEMCIFKEEDEFTK